MEIEPEEKQTIYKIFQKIKEASDKEVYLNFKNQTARFFLSTDISFLVSLAESIGKSLIINSNYQAPHLDKDTTPLTTPDKQIHKSLIKNKMSLALALKIIGVVFATFTTFLGLFAIWYFIPKAEVSLTLNSESLVKSVEITIDPKATGVDTVSKIIPGSNLSVTRTERKALETTGETVVGEKARGKITFINKTDKDKEISSGTVLTLDSDSKLKYTLMEDVKIPKRVDVTPTTIEAGKVEGKIEALEFGDKYNQGKDKMFTIENENKSNYLAQNDKEELKGGESSKVKAVAREDVEKISEELEVTIKKSLEDDLKNKLVEGQDIAKGSITIAIVEQIFDKKIGESGENLTLEETAKAETIAFSKSHLKEVLASSIKEAVPEKYLSFETDPEIEIGEALAQKTITTESGSKKLIIQVKVKSYIVPKVDTANLTKMITGQRILEAEKIIEQISGVSSYEILVTPQMPSPVMTLPHLEKRITIITKHK